MLLTRLERSIFGSSASVFNIKLRATFFSLSISIIINFFLHYTYFVIQISLSQLIVIYVKNRSFAVSELDLIRLIWLVIIFCWYVIFVCTSISFFSTIGIQPRQPTASNSFHVCVKWLTSNIMLPTKCEIFQFMILIPFCENWLPNQFKFCYVINVIISCLCLNFQTLSSII